MNIDDTRWWPFVINFFSWMDGVFWHGRARRYLRVTGWTHFQDGYVSCMGGSLRSDWIGTHLRISHIEPI